MNYKVVVDEDTVPSFKVGDRVKFKKSSIDSGMIDATEDDVFIIKSYHEEHWGNLVKLDGITRAVNVSHLEHVKEEIMEEQKINWEVGHTVWCVIFGKGVVVEIEQDTDYKYPVKVHFEDGTREEYSLNGRMFETGFSNRSIFFSEPKIEAELFPPKKPFVPTLKKGDRVHLYTKGGLFPEGVVREVFSEVEDRVYVSPEGHYFMKYDIESIRILGEEIKFS